MFLKIFLIFFLAATSCTAFCSDELAKEAFSKGRDLEKKGKNISAAENYLEANVQADDPVLKANALMNAARTYRKAKKYGYEFECLQKLAKGHIGRINFRDVVNRQYEIGDEYFKGYREYFVSWIPFITKEDRCTEIFEAALANAPCADRAPDTRLRLARLYIEKSDPEKAIRHLTETIKLYPSTEQARYAALELSSVFMQLAERGDGDGKNAREALEAFDTFIRTHPDDPEVEWVKRSREQVRNYIAGRLRKLGEYYRSKGRADIAERYLASAVKDYPAAPETAKAEKVLSSINRDYKPSAKNLTAEQRKFREEALPKENAPVMVIPMDSGGKWLIPVRNLKAGVKEPHYEIKEKINDDML